MTNKKKEIRYNLLKGIREIIPSVFILFIILYISFNVAILYSNSDPVKILFLTMLFTITIYLMLIFMSVIFLLFKFLIKYGDEFNGRKAIVNFELRVK